ncbi:hypothetical protein [Halopiger djelfimassiliensis]|uniref:hypothetical protein n=1 Tax=Halopiger djelfimassiliensis TaxID=1293047 RepID=UPI000677FB24|nr:hypothetical protein [Halopiger djelfimassiliensis]
MDPLREGSRLRRRTFLIGSSIAASSFAGCLDNDEETNETNGGNSNGGDGGGDGDDGESDDGESGDTTAPEPDFTVGPSDEADYETLQEAYDALASGDVIGLEPGEYTVQPTVEYADDVNGEDLIKTYTYVGESAEETTIALEMPEATSFIVKGPLRFLPDDGAPGFWNVTLDIPDELSYARAEGDWNFNDDDADDHVIAANYCRINGSLGGPTDAYDSTFNDALSHRMSARNCRFRGDVGGGRLAARDCQFQGRVTSANGYMVDSTIEGTVNLNHMTALRCEMEQGMNITGDGAAKHCVIESKPDDRLAIDIRSEYEATVFGCEIYGTVRSNRDGSYIDRFERNTFDVPSGTRYIIDGAPATEIFLNAFIGGDVRITTDTGDLNSFPSNELTLYDPERELGNYYAQWEQVSTADEGILETRTLPGDDGAMDRYPLANPDVDAYAEAAAEEEEEDD